MSLRDLAKPSAARALDTAISTIVAVLLVEAGSAGIAAFILTLRERTGSGAGDPVWLIGAGCLVAGTALWCLTAWVFARATAVGFGAALRFDAWTYIPCLLLYLPTLRPELPLLPVGVGAGTALIAKLPLYWALPRLEQREAQGELVSRERLRGVAVAAVTVVSLFGLMTTNSFDTGTIPDTVRFMIEHPNASYVERMAEKGRGHYAAYFTFIRAVTPEDAVILRPPGLPVWYAEADSQLALAALWPRHVREASSLELTPTDLQGITHVLVTVVKNKPLPEAPASFRWPQPFPPGRFLRFQDGAWGVIELERRS